MAILYYTTHCVLESMQTHLENVATALWSWFNALVGTPKVKQISKLVFYEALFIPPTTP